VGEIVTTPGDRGWTLPEGVANKPVTMLTDEMGGTVIVENWLDTMLGGRELELEVTFTWGTRGGRPGIVPWAGTTLVVFQAGHSEDLASRRTGH